MLASEALNHCEVIGTMSVTARQSFATKVLPLVNRAFTEEMDIGQSEAPTQDEGHMQFGVGIGPAALPLAIQRRMSVALQWGSQPRLRQLSRGRRS